MKGFLGRLQGANPAMGENAFRRFVASKSESEYLELMVRSLSEPSIQGVAMPGFPAREVQEQFVGSSDEHALREGNNFYRIVKSYCASLGVPLQPNVKVLDFGCGWGRIARFFFRELRSDSFYGVDVDPAMIAFCQSALPCGTYATVNPLPPMAFDYSSLDVIFAYSVFSHLAEHAARAWIGEFARVLKPGGILLATTQRRGFLDFCESLQRAQGEPASGWHKSLARSFIPIEQAKRDFDDGKFLYAATGGGGPRDSSFYGEAIIPEAYIRREYAPLLEFRVYLDDATRLPQALFVLQKGGHSGSGAAAGNRS
jgi:SAM-dependent methyltransferase